MNQRRCRLYSRHVRTPHTQLVWKMKLTAAPNQLKYIPVVIMCRLRIAFIRPYLTGSAIVIKITF